MFTYSGCLIKGLAKDNLYKKWSVWRLNLSLYVSFPDHLAQLYFWDEFKAGSIVLPDLPSEGLFWLNVEH